MPLYGTVPPFWDLEIPVDIISIISLFFYRFCCFNPNVSMVERYYSSVIQVIPLLSILNHIKPYKTHIKAI